MESTSKLSQILRNLVYFGRHHHRLLHHRKRRDILCAFSTMIHCRELVRGTEMNVDTIVGSSLQKKPVGMPSTEYPTGMLSNNLGVETSSQTVSTEDPENFCVKDKLTDFQKNKNAEYDRNDVTICHSSTQRIYNINLRKTDDQVSLFIRHRAELIDFKLSEKFKKSVEGAHLVREESHQVSPPISSIDDLVSSKALFNYKQLPVYYLRLAKIRLTGLVVSTAMAGYALAPGSFDIVTFTFCTLGTGFISSAANSINQCMEIQFDSQMNRTKNRPLVTGQLSSLHALLFAGVTGTVGTTMLALGVNPLTATLGVINIGLYTAIYTPMKRLSIGNTWVGAVVGAVPPMMGWAASSGTLHTGAWLLGAIMYAWQFPHFCALSWNLRSDYSRAGYRMMAVDNPDLCKRVSLRYSIAMTGLCTLAPYLNVTTWMFAFDSLPFNVTLMYFAWRFYRDGDSRSSRQLFHFSLIHLPAILVLMIISKKRYSSNIKIDRIETEVEQNVVAKTTGASSTALVTQST